MRRVYIRRGACALLTLPVIIVVAVYSRLSGRGTVYIGRSVHRGASMSYICFY